MNEKTNTQFGFEGKWLHANKEALARWQKELMGKIEKREEPVRENPVIGEFRELIAHDPVVRMYLTEMIEQIPPNPFYDDYRLQNIEEMLELLNMVLTIAPDYNDTLLVGTPFSAILIWTMGTPAGFAAYRNEKINAMFKKLLGQWQKFLDSKESRYVLNDSPNGWMCKKARAQLKMDNYQYKPDEKYWGFKSWNDFFTRKLAKGVRPISDPNNNKVVVSACDSTVYKISHNVDKYSKFWIKTQPYSLMDMLYDPKHIDGKLVDQFVGGDVYQAFLSPFNYHRWHSPIAGTIKKAFVKEGLYFSQADCEGEDPNDQDASEGYIAQVQTRAIFVIEADDPGMGLVVVMPIGMVEISTCKILDKIQPGYHVDKGEEIGHFAFGGSTHCLIFQKGVIDHFTRKKGDSVEMGKTIVIAN